jgi:hypothetical protein
LAQHFLEGVALRILIAAGNGLDLGAGRAQALLEGIGGVQDLPHGPLTTAAALAQQQREDRGHDGDDQQEGGDAHWGDPDGWGSSLPWPTGRGKFPAVHQGLV